MLLRQDAVNCRDLYTVMCHSESLLKLWFWDRDLFLSSVNFGTSLKLLLCHQTLLCESNTNLTGLGADMASICLSAGLHLADLWDDVLFHCATDQFKVKFQQVVIKAIECLTNRYDSQLCQKRCCWEDAVVY